jgi:hypothetical protein
MTHMTNYLEQSKMFLIGQALEKYCASSDPHDECLHYHGVSVQKSADEDYQQAINFSTNTGNSFDLRCKEALGKFSCDLFKQFKVVQAGNCGGSPASPNMSVFGSKPYYDATDVHVEMADGYSEPETAQTEISYDMNDQDLKQKPDSIEDVVQDKLTLPDKSGDGDAGIDITDVGSEGDQELPLNPDAGDLQCEADGYEFADEISLDDTDANEIPVQSDSLPDSFEVEVTPPLVCDADGDGTITEAFADLALLAAIRNALGKGENDDITMKDVANTGTLNLSNAGLTDLIGLQCFSKLSVLHLVNNAIEDISPLADMEQLTMLELNGNFVSDITPLAGKEMLSALYLDNNLVSDLSPLSSITSLKTLGLPKNAISDLAPLAGLSQLSTLNLYWNLVEDINPLAGILSLTNVSLEGNLIEDISPLAGLTNLVSLYLPYNKVEDISPLAELTGLVTLAINFNNVKVIPALQNLTNLKTLWINNNQIKDITPLLDNDGIGSGDVVWPYGNPIPTEQIDALKAKGVDVK